MKNILQIYALLSLLSSSLHLYSSQQEKTNIKKNNTLASLPTIASVSTISYLAYQKFSQPTQHTSQVSTLHQEKNLFPLHFDWGVATSSTQNEESSTNNSWSAGYLQSLGKSDINPALIGCKSWTETEDDIEKIKYLGINAYRFSIEWSRVQPTQGQFDEAAIQHYVDFVKKLQAAGIKPMVCLHHYSDPIWFLNRGGFSKEENINIFTQYCQKMYEALRPYVANWIVISQPAAYAIKGYDQGMQPPFIKESGLGEKVMLNLFKAHIQVYDIMHNTYEKTRIGQEPNIGICHQISQMQAYTSYNPIDHLAANFADRIYNKAFLRFFTTGHLRGLKPLLDIAFIPDAPKKFDFFALSYYCSKSFSGLTPITPKAEQSHQTADATRIIDKDGMYNALVQASKLGKPVYVVESGIDPIDEEQRILLLNSYLSAIAQATHDGYDIRGYYYWTLMDSYEWAKPFNSTHFGLYKNRVINEEGQLRPDYQNHEALLKEGGKYYKAVIAQHTLNPKIQ